MTTELFLLFYYQGVLSAWLSPGWLALSTLIPIRIVGHHRAFNHDWILERIADIAGIELDPREDRGLDGNSIVWSPNPMPRTILPSLKSIKSDICKEE
jgi:hypothetical protein